MRYINSFVLTVLVVSGCTAVNPYVPYSPPISPISGSSDTAIDLALAQLRVDRETLDGMHREQLAIRGGAKAGALLGTLGAVAAGLYDGSRDLIVGFGLGAGSSYVAGTIVSPEGYPKAYRDGLAAYACVEEAAVPAAAKIDSVIPLRNRLVSSKADLDSLFTAANVRIMNLEASDSATDVKEQQKNIEKKQGAAAGQTSTLPLLTPERVEIVGLKKVMPDIVTVQTASHTALAVADGLIASGTDIAGTIDVARSRIRKQVNARVEAFDLGPGAVAQLAAQAGAIGLTGIAPSVSGVLALGKDVKKARTLESAAADSLAVTNLKAAAARVEADKAVLLAAMGDFDLGATKTAIDGCSAIGDAVSPLTVVPSGEIEVKQGSGRTIKIVGTRTPLRLETDPTPLSGISVSAESDSIRVAATATVAVDTTFKIFATEYSNPPRSVQIQLKVVAP